LSAKTHNDKQSYVYILVTHATLIEFCSLKCENTRQKSDCCAINVFENQVFGGKDGKGEISGGNCGNFAVGNKTVCLMKNYMAYQNFKQWERATEVKTDKGWLGRVWSGFMCNFGKHYD
jgi:hypothetical protein